MSRISPLIVLAFCCLFYFALVDNARGPVYPEILKDFNIAPNLGGYFFAIASFSGLIVTLLAGYWLKYIHLKQSFIIASLFLGSSAGALGLANMLNSKLLLFSSSVLIGAGMGFCSMSMNLAIEYEVPIQLRRRAFAALHTTYGIASLISPLLFSGFLFFKQGWSFYFYFLAVLGLIMPLTTWWQQKAPAVYVKQSGQPTKRKSQRLPLYLLLILSLCVGTYVAAEIAISSRLVYYLQSVHSYPLEQASNSLSLFFLLLMGGRLALASYSWQISSLTLMIVSLLATMSFTLIGNTFYPYAMALTGLSMSIFFPSMMDWLGEKFSNDFTQVTSFALTGIGAHLTLMHIGFGKVVSILGLVKAMYIPFCLILISLVTLLLFKLMHESYERKII